MSRRESQDKVLELIRALADPTRLEISRLLALEQLSVRQLVGRLELSQPLVSHHLKVLREAGLVEARRRSYWSYYRLNPELLASVIGELAGLRDAAVSSGEVPSGESTYVAGRNPRRTFGMRCMAEPGPQVEEAVEGLAAEFVGTFSRSTVERYVRDSLEHYGGSRDHDRIPVLTKNYARQRLRALAEAEGSFGSEVPQILFVCVQNAGRSQIAAALVRRVAGNRVGVRSAGSTPAWDINDTVHLAIQEAGLDLTEEFPKPLTDEFVRAADIVVTMGCGDACPIYSGKRYEDWAVEDPAGKSLEQVREIRDDIAGRVEMLLEDLWGPATP